MDILEVQQSGGYPLETDTLNFMQETYKLLNAFSFLAGDKSIIAGCNQLGSHIGDGVIIMNNEILPFVGGTMQNRVVVMQTTETKNFEDGTAKAVFKRRYATFGAGVGSALWSDFTRIQPAKTLSGLVDRIEALEHFAAPFAAGGSMVFWNKPANQIPTGWEEDTDWRGKMPIGFSEYEEEFDSIGKTGGAKNVSLTAENNGPHSHTGTAEEDGEHLHGYETAIPSGTTEYGVAGVSQKFSATSMNTAPSGNHTHTLNIEESGAGDPFSVLNPYRVVMFIKPIIE